MTLREIRATHPGLFYQQEWFSGESFLDVEADPGVGMPTSVSRSAWRDSVPAATLARLYAENPADPIWARYLWTCDFDSQGQRVYVGDNGKGLEIHRHLHLTERWGVPCWE